MGHEVEVYEYNEEPRVVCGGGISIDALRDISIGSDLNPEQYILWRAKSLIVKFCDQEFKMDVTNSCIYNKEKFILDVISSSNAQFHLGVRLQTQEYCKYDLVIDASGIRAGLGKLPKDNFYFCYQVKAAFESKLPYPDSHG